MSQDQSAGPQERSTVIAWEGSDVLRGAGWPILFGGLRRHRWLAPTIAAIGAAALFASFIEEWQITELRSGGDFHVDDDFQTISTGVAWLDGWSAPYLMGIFAVTACLALVFFGPRAAREHVRIAGVAMSGVLLAVLVAIAVDLGRASAAFNGVVFSPIHEQLDLSYGRGLMAAFGGVVCYALALLLTGRLSPAQPPRVTHPEGGVDVGDRESAPEERDWPWRGPRTASAATPGYDYQPLDLTVGPTKPFVRPEEQDGR